MDFEGPQAALSEELSALEDMPWLPSPARPPLSTHLLTTVCLEYG